MKNKHIPVIVLDAVTYTPMAWDGKQFVFTQPVKLNSKKTIGIKVKTYQKQDALQLIKSDLKFRKDNNFESTEFLLCLVTHGKV
jgi:hypothetical protein